MSLGKRFLDLARANVRALLDRDGGREGSREELLGALSDEELELELALRRDRRRRHELVQAAHEAAAREARQRREARSADEELPRPPRPDGARPRVSHASAPADETPWTAPEPPDRPHDPALAAHYARLETPYGADLATVKRSFHRLMRRFHPDLNQGDATQAQLAHEVSRELTVAYEALERALGDRAPGGPA